MDAHFLISLLIFLLAAVISIPIAHKLGVGSVLGYLMAGIVIGPSCLGLIRSVRQVYNFSEIGIVLFLFLVGLELRPKMLWTMRSKVFWGGMVQLGLCSALLACFFVFLISLGKHPGLIAISAFALSLSSTAVALQILEEKHLIKSQSGDLAFSVLLFQDLAVIPILSLLPLLVHNQNKAFDVTSVSWWMQAAKILGWLGVTIFFAPRALRIIFKHIVNIQAREIFTSFSLLFVIGMAFVAKYLGLSMGLGSFLAGVLLADSEYKHALESNIEPFKGLLLGLFFISIGMSIELGHIMHDFSTVIVITVVVMLVKLLVMIGMIRILKFPRQQTLNIAWCLVPVSEFAFVILTSARGLGIFNQEQVSILSSSAVLSMVFTPLALLVTDKIQKRANKNDQTRSFDIIADNNPAIIIAGFGRFGQIIGRLLFAHNIKATVLDINPEQIDLLSKFGFKVYYGDATRLDLLEAAGIAKAKILVVAIDDIEASLNLVEMVKQTFPHIEIFARARNMQHVYDLKERGIQHWEREMFEASLRLGGKILKQMGISAYQARKSMYSFRDFNLKTIEEMYLVRNDESKLTSQSKAASEQLNKMFEQDVSHIQFVKEGWEGEIRDDENLA